MGFEQLFEQMQVLYKALSFVMAFYCKLGHSMVGLCMSLLWSLTKLYCTIKGSLILISQHGYRVINQPASH